MKSFITTVLILITATLVVSCNNEVTEDYIDYSIDTDGDGIADSQELLDGTNKNDPCDPAHDSSYTAFDKLNNLWLAGDCDGDGVLNSKELEANSNPYGETIITEKVIAVPEFTAKLSEMKLFKGNITDFEYGDNTYLYELSTPLYTDYAHKLRVISIPEGEQMTYIDGGLLDFPNNTIMAKTFYYMNDERDVSKGKHIIETRVLIKKNDEWLIRNYVWNENQTDADLDDDGHELTVAWIDQNGESRTLPYAVPANAACITCHTLHNIAVPIGPKARAMNFTVNGKNQISYFIEKGILKGAPPINTIPTLADWSNTEIPLEDRARAYLDVNCAHCHQDGGNYNAGSTTDFDLRYELDYEDTNIAARKEVIKERITDPNQTERFFMPLIGTTTKHTEGIELIEDYLNSLD